MLPAAHLTGDSPVIVSESKKLAASVQDTFAKEGLSYSMEGLTGNTFNSHRLIAFAGRQGPDVQDRVVEELFKAYFTQVCTI
jgi:predicted DsbA family dithiol-disulfide isomerase